MYATRFSENLEHEIRQYNPDALARQLVERGQTVTVLTSVGLKETEALLLPSRVDSFGIVLLESWLYSYPVVVAASGGIPSDVDNGNNGILVPFGDISSLSNAIKLLTEDQELEPTLNCLPIPAIRFATAPMLRR